MQRFSFLMFVVMIFPTFLVADDAGDAADFDASQIRMPLNTRINIAHRGHSYLAPENTLLAYRIAIQSGANGGECDVYRTSDGVIILGHDPTMKRTMGGKDVKITETPYSEIQQCDAGVWKGKQFQGEKVPTLGEYLDLLKGSTCHPVIEIKMEEIEQPVLDAIHERDMLAESTIITFSEPVVLKIRELEPNICVAFLYSEQLPSGTTAKENADRLAKLLMEKCSKLGTNVLDLNHGILSEKLVRTLQARGIHVWAWTVDDPARMNQLLDWGVESITTNRPDLLADVLKKVKR